jgi:hypothetical protein
VGIHAIRPSARTPKTVPSAGVVAEPATTHAADTARD